MSRDVRLFIRVCEVCQKMNATNKPPATTLHPISIKDVFHRWDVDMVGPLNETCKCCTSRAFSTPVIADEHQATVR